MRQLVIIIIIVLGSLLTSFLVYNQVQALSLPSIPSLGVPGPDDLLENFQNNQENTPRPPGKDNTIDGHRGCGPELFCSPDQTCQKRFRNILPSGPNPFLSTGREKLGNIFRAQPEHIADASIGHEVTGYNSPNEIAIEWDYTTGEPPEQEVVQNNENITGHTVEEVDFNDLNNDEAKFSVDWDDASRTITVPRSEQTQDDSVITVDQVDFTLNEDNQEQLDTTLDLSNLDPDATYRWEYQLESTTEVIETFDPSKDNPSKTIEYAIDISGLTVGTSTYTFTLHRVDSEGDIIENEVLQYQTDVEINPASYTWKLNEGGNTIIDFTSLQYTEMTQNNLPADLRYANGKLFYTGSLDPSQTYTSQLSSPDVEGDLDVVEFKTPKLWTWEIYPTDPLPGILNETGTSRNIGDMSLNNGNISKQDGKLVYNGLEPDTTYESRIIYLNYDGSTSQDTIRFTTNRENNSDDPDESRTGKPIKAKYECVDPPRIPGVEGSPYFDGRTENGYNNSSPNLNDAGVPVNVINQGPVPVDLFNYPNPINTNVVSPNPLPVRVIDDLPMYHQTRVDEAQAAIQQARTTQQTANSVMNKVNEENLAIRNPEEIRQNLLDSVIRDPTTGLESTVIAEHGDNPEINLNEIDALFDSFQAKEDLTYLSPETTNTACGEGVTREEASGIGLTCALSFLEPQNRPDGQQYEIWQKANANFEIAQEHTDQMIEDGYYPATEDGDRNPFTAQIKTPASTISETVDQTVTASLNQVINDSGVAGDACWGRLPGQAIDGTLNPVLRDGILKDIENLNVDGEETDEGLTEADQFIQNDLAQSLVAGANCEVSRTVDNILAGTPLAFDLESGSLGIQENIDLWGLGINANGEFNVREGTLEAFNLGAGELGNVRVVDGKLEFNSEIYDDGVEAYNDINGLLDQFGGEDEEPMVEDFLDAGEYDFEDDVILEDFEE